MKVLSTLDIAVGRRLALAEILRCQYRIEVVPEFGMLSIHRLHLRSVAARNDCRTNPMTAQGGDKPFEACHILVSHLLLKGIQPFHYRGMLVGYISKKLAEYLLQRTALYRMFQSWLFGMILPSYASPEHSILWFRIKHHTIQVE